MYIKILEEIFKALKQDYIKDYVLYKQPYEKTMISLIIYLRNKNHINILYEIGNKYNCKRFDSESIVFIDNGYRYLYSITNVNDIPTLQLNITLDNKNSSFMFLKSIIKDESINDIDYNKMHTELGIFAKQYL